MSGVNEIRSTFLDYFAKAGHAVVPSSSLVPQAVSDKSLSGKVTTVGENGPADGLIIAKGDGRLYVTSPQDDSVKVRDLSGNNAGLTVLLQDKRLRWPDTLSEGPDGTLYVTTSHIQDSAMYRKDAPIALPTELWSFKPGKSITRGPTDTAPR